MADEERLVDSVRSEVRQGKTKQQSKRRAAGPINSGVSLGLS